MGTFQRGRHAPAFILLCLTDGEAYGLELIERIKDFIPGNKMDRAILYRTLGKLEKEGKITVRLDATQSGPVRKYYSLTKDGYEELGKYEKDIRFRVKNLIRFLDKYDSLQNNTKENE